MTISAKIVADSISKQDIRLTTMQLRYPKFIHGEFLTHRNFSRNASSSRAIPVERLIQDVIDDPAMPVFWGRNQAGMQAAEELDHQNLSYTRPDGTPGTAREKAIEIWLRARDKAVSSAHVLRALGAHKQIVNRLLEPWCHINVVVTSTEWSNFFALRCHEAAQPEMRVLAEAMRDAMGKSEPKKLKPGQWHLPYCDELTEDIVDLQSFHEHEVRDKLIKVSVARCARVSYLTQEGKPPNIKDDLKLYDRLVGSVPLHASPAEHQATPDISHFNVAWDRQEWEHPEQHGNLVGWRSWRKMLPNENVLDR